jgi:SulP family sulfate permease
MIGAIKTFPKIFHLDSTLLYNLQHIPRYFLRPIRLFKSYDPADFRPDLIAGLTVGVVILPQVIAFALIAELPPEMGLYTAIIGGAVGALWGSCKQIQTGPANTISLLILSILLPIAAPGTPNFLAAAGMMAVMVGFFQLSMGLARLGMLVNFVSHSVVVGFSSGAGVLIAINEFRHLLGLQFQSRGVTDTVYNISTHLLEPHWPTMLLGLSAIVLLVLLRKLYPKLPGSLISMSVASLIVFFFSLDQAGVSVIGQLPSGLPPLADLPLFDLNFIARLSTGALAVGAISLVQTSAVGRSIAAQTGQRLDNNQEFVGQGLANIACGLFSGYSCAGSFSSSAVNFKAGSRTPLSSIVASTFILVAIFTLAPLAAFLPRAAVAGALTVTAYNMIDRAEITRILRGAPGDALIMVVTFLGTLFLHLEFAVLLGILLSFALYIMKTSVPQVFSVLPDANFRHFIQQQSHQKLCPQLGILKISGDLYFGAVSHIEEAIHQHLTDHPNQRFLLFRMHGVNQCDFSGIHMLETIRHACQERGGDIYFMKLQQPVLALMKSTGFYNQLGPGHFLEEEVAISYLFHKILDPVVCIYECPNRAFIECQNLPKRNYPIHLDIPGYTPNGDIGNITNIGAISPHELRQKLRGDHPPIVIDVRERREFKRGHIPQAQLIPLPKIISDPLTLPRDQEIVLVCRSGRRSVRAACSLQHKGCHHITILQGGMLAWETAGLLEAIDQ